MANQPNPAIPDPQTASQHLLGTVTANVFFQKLAQHYGIQPSNEKEAADLLQLGADLYAIEQQTELSKQASDENLFAEARSALHGVVSGTGLDQPIKQASDTQQEAARYELAATLAQDPSIYNSVLSLKAAMFAAAEAASQDPQNNQE